LEPRLLGKDATLKIIIILMTMVTLESSYRVDKFRFKLLFCPTKIIDIDFEYALDGIEKVSFEIFVFCLRLFCSQNRSHE